MVVSENLMWKKISLWFGLIIDSFGLLYCKFVKQKSPKSFVMYIFRQFLITSHPSRVCIYCPRLLLRLIFRFCVCTVLILFRETPFKGWPQSSSCTSGDGLTRRQDLSIFCFLPLSFLFLFLSCFFVHRISSWMVCEFYILSETKN